MYLDYKHLYDDGRPQRADIYVNEVGIDITFNDEETNISHVSAYIEYREGKIILRYWDIVDGEYYNDPTGEVVLADQKSIADLVQRVERENKKPQKDSPCICGHSHEDHEKNVDPETGKAYDPPYNTRCTKCGCIGFRRA